MVKKNKYIALSLCACSLFFGYVVNASEIECNTAKMQAMDKITGRVNIIEIPVGGEVKFACIDGPDFDAHKIDFDEIINRTRIYKPEEKRCDETKCNLIKQAMKL